MITGHAAYLNLDIWEAPTIQPYMYVDIDFPTGTVRLSPEQLVSIDFDLSLFGTGEVLCGTPQDGSIEVQFYDSTQEYNPSLNTSLGYGTRFSLYLGNYNTLDGVQTGIGVDSYSDIQQYIVSEVPFILVQQDIGFIADVINTHNIYRLSERLKRDSVYFISGTCVYNGVSEPFSELLRVSFDTADATEYFDLSALYADTLPEGVFTLEHFVEIDVAEPYGTWVSYSWHYDSTSCLATLTGVSEMYELLRFASTVDDRFSEYPPGTSSGVDIGTIIEELLTLYAPVYAAYTTDERPLNTFILFSFLLYNRANIVEAFCKLCIAAIYFNQYNELIISNGLYGTDVLDTGIISDESASAYTIADTSEVSYTHVQYSLKAAYSINDSVSVTNTGHAYVEIASYKSSALEYNIPSIFIGLEDVLCGIIIESTADYNELIEAEIDAVLGTYSTLLIINNNLSIKLCDKYNEKNITYMHFCKEPYFSNETISYNPSEFIGEKPYNVACNLATNNSSFDQIAYILSTASGFYIRYLSSTHNLIEVHFRGNPGIWIDTRLTVRSKLYGIQGVYKVIGIKFTYQGSINTVLNLQLCEE